MKRVFVLFFLIMCTCTNLLQAQKNKETGAADAETDPQDKKLEKLMSRYEYHFFQRRKPFISDTKRREHKDALDRLEKEIMEVHQQKTKKKLNADSLAAELASELVSFKEPVYAYEAPSQWINGGVWFGAKNTSSPFVLAAEKTVGDKISLGVFCGVFSEKAQVLAPDNFSEHPGYVFSEGNYKYTYIAPGIKGSYHFFNADKPALGLSPKKFDVYVTALLGFNMIVNKNFLPNSPVALEDPSKEGLNYGLMGGFRYAYTKHVGFFVEAGYSRLGFASAGVSFRWLK